MKPRKNNLSAAEITKQVDVKYKKTKRVQFEDGHTIDIEMLFRPSKKDALIVELMELLQSSYEKEKKVDAAVGIGLTIALVVKCFTSLETDAQSCEELLSLIRTLKDGGYLDTILAAFEQTELDSIFNDLKIAIDKVNHGIKLAMQEFETGEESK
ncbi:hypothetical protein [Cohnella terricola]|uniref:Uncharacterized protein n=1 Tax=Cohnella terricola TaxID=1289167 RepID=A0A559JDL3_9BACL|nr:hypothetical protein [Cohnella terricola]TVX97966.1 hypothetical protein FPZ45_17120 [Cohnella terricola]